MEEQSNIKHEYIDGQIFAMASECDTHVTIALNLAANLRRRVRGSGCRVYICDMKAQIEALNRFYYLIEFEPTGSMTQAREGEVSAEAEESYCFGESTPTPDLVIEVVFHSSSSKKLQRYQVLGVPEVWFWQDGLFSLYHLRGGFYEKISRSEIP